MNIFAFMVKNKKGQSIMRKGILFLMLTLIITTLLGGVAMSASAAYKDGWIVDGYKTSGATSTVNKNDSDEVNNKKDVSTIESFAAWLIAAPGYAFDEAIRSTGIDCSISGIVMGRLASGQSYFQFDLSDGNIYGIIGATLYIGFRAMAMTALIILVAVGIIKSLLYSDVKSFTEMKQAIIGGVIALLVMLMMPLAVDYLVKVRDTVSLWFYDIAKDFSGTSNVGTAVAAGNGTTFSAVNLATTYRKTYEEHSDLVNAIIYTAVCFLPLTYIINYTKIAITQLVLFGSFPAFCAIGAKDKKAISNWMSVFITNLFIPAVDMTLLLLPQLIITKMSDAVIATTETTKASYVGWELLKAVITITAFMFVIPAREQLLKMLGNYIGVPMGGGLFAAGAMVGAAAKGLADGAKDMGKGLGGLMGKDKDGGDGGDGPSAEKGNEDAMDDPNGGIGGKGMDDVESSPGSSEFDATGDGGDEQNDNINENTEDGALGGEGADEEAADELTEDEQLADNENEALAAGDEESAEDADGALEGENADELGSTEGADGIEDADADELAAGDGAGEEAGADMSGLEGGEDIDGEAGDADGADMENAIGADSAPADIPSDGEEGADGADMVEGADITGASSGADFDVAGASDESIDTSEGDLAAGDIADGAPADIPSDGGAGVSGGNETVQEDVANAVSGASVSASDLEGSVGSDVDDISKNNAQLGEAVKENSPSEMTDFNMSRAANLATMDNIRESMDGLDTQNNKLSAEADNVKAQMAVNNADIASTRAEQKAFLDEQTNGGKTPLSEEARKTNAEYNSTVNGLVSKNADLAKQGTGIEKQIAHNNSVKAGLNAELGRRAGIEKSNAKKAEGMTGNGQVFKSSGDMVKSLKHDNNMRKMANYKNYNAAEFKGTMTNQQRAEYAKTQKRAEAAGQVASGAAKAARAYVTAMATVAAMGGGEAQMRQVQSHVSKETESWSSTASKTTEYVVSGEAKKDVQSAVESAKATANQAKATAKNAASSLRNGDAARNAVAGAFNAGRAVKSGAQAAAQKTVDTVTSIPKVPGKVANAAVNAAVGAKNAVKDTAVNNFKGAKEQFRAERDKSKAGPANSGIKVHNLDTGKTKTLFAEPKPATKSAETKAAEYTSSNTNGSDPVIKEMEAKAEADAKKNVKDFKDGK